ncbi:FliH/SctL family protein [Salinibacterium sp. ZJ450]|uniref:FliH/SctL family protein n=1 Tax=Salinibacterium sp. ZJ450 TaxID=2708338 RepID=UPI00141EC4E5|nr:FliH/SctL family protein [Salinibacterium sp. ZJ450]
MSTDTAFSPVVYPVLRGSNEQKLQAQAHTAGHAAGYTEGLRAAAADTAVVRARLEQESVASIRRAEEQNARALAVLAMAARALDDRTVPVVIDAQNTLAAAAIELAEAILGYELAHGENTARAALDRALGTVDPDTVRSVRMNPDDLAELDAATRAKGAVSLVADPTLGRGDAITEFPDGYLDARIGTALDRARDALLGEMDA